INPINKKAPPRFFEGRSPGGWFDKIFKVFPLFVAGSGEVAEGDIRRIGFLLGSAGVRDTAVACAFQRLSLCDDTSTFEFESFDCDPPLRLRTIFSVMP
ncbi:MAG: hypothetical protein WCG66_09935, partial [bacterium]